jgi:polar amino acid transport system substrate-binding protein
MINVSATPLTFISEQNPPVNYEESNHKAAGFSVELLKLVWQQMEEPAQPIHFLPWARAYYTAQTKAGSVLFATSRTVDRENMFKWVCPISTSAVALFQHKNAQHDLTTLTSISNYKIGVVRADIAEDVVVAKVRNHSRLVRTVNLEQLIRLLQSGKVDIIAAYEPVVYTTLQQLGLKASDYSKDFVLEEMTDCYAFNRNTSDEVVLAYQQALTKVRSSVEYQTLVTRYHMLNFQ